MNTTTNKYRDEQQLCWCCAKATGNMGGCAWERSAKPIKGWKATPVVRAFQNNGPVSTTYVIKECPEFVRDTNDSNLSGSTFAEIPKSKYTDIGCRRLLEELVFQTGSELLETSSPLTEYYLSDFLHTIGANSILDTILKSKGKTWNDVQRNGSLAK